MATLSKSFQAVLNATKPSSSSCRRALLSTTTISNTTTLHPESSPIPSQSNRLADLSNPTSCQSSPATQDVFRRRPAWKPPISTYKPRHPALSGRPPPPKPTSKDILKDELDPSVQTLLPLLRSQPPFYATIQIHGKNYFIQAGDSIRLPFVMQGVEPGDVIRMNRAILVGSKDYTLKAGTTETKRDGQKFLDERLYVARARVMGVVKEPERTKVKTKPRQRHARYTVSQHSYTMLKVMEVDLTDFGSQSSHIDDTQPVELPTEV
jgi:large subunit ribosomal protein L21